MNERIQRTGQWRREYLGGGREMIQDQYKVLSRDFRQTLETFWDLTKAVNYLEQQVRMEQTACGSGGCED